MNITKTLIICIVALFQTVTLSNAAVHTSVAPKSNPQDYSSVPTSTTNYITQPSCFDKLNNCGDYGNDACLGIFHYWALENCQRHCEMCNTTFPKGCYDKEPLICSSEADAICTNTAYKAYVEVNCQKTCYQCSGHIRTTPTLVERAKGGKTLLKSVTKAIYCNLALTKGCSYKGVHYQHNAQWKDGCKKCTCINGLYNCVEICPQYQWPNWPLGKSTRGCCPSHVIGVGDPVCNYGGKEYKQDETWSDGCQFSCVCNDGKAGQYQCKEKCPKWDLPDVCHWNPAPPGKCCRQPECPLPYVITGYPDY